MKKTIEELAAVEAAARNARRLACIEHICDYELEYLTPYQTPPGAEGRTFQFRAECLEDVRRLRAMIDWSIETYWHSLVALPDVDVKMTLKPNTLSIDELRWLFGQVPDCHVALQSLELASNYTGERKGRDEYDLGAVVPKRAFLKRAIAGMTEYVTDCRELAESRELYAEATLESLRGGATQWRQRYREQYGEPLPRRTPKAVE